jgi:hypothetical protein
MVALTADRNTPELEPGERVGLLGASQQIFNGALLMRNASGHLIEGATATGSFGVGRAETRGASTTAGVTSQRYRPGIFRWANSAAGDLIAEADRGAVCYIVDDQTVAKTSGTNTRSPAGVVEAVDAQGVWVRMDEALTRAMLS